MKKSTRTKNIVEHPVVLGGIILVFLVLGLVGNLIKPINPNGAANVGENEVVIQNQLGADLVLVIDKRSTPRGVVIVAHGLGGNKDEPEILALAESFKKHNFTVVRYDASNARGESGGYVEDAKTATYIQDMTAVVDWTKAQSWFKQPLVLAGHSLGATSAALYAEAHPGDVAGLVLISGVVSGTLHFQEAPKRTPADWEQTWQQISNSLGQEGPDGSVNWFAFMIDLLRFNLLKESGDLSMPVLIIVGEKDELAPVTHQQRLYNSLPGPKELKIIAGAGHSLESPTELSQLKLIVGNWLASQLR